MLLYLPNKFSFCWVTSPPPRAMLLSPPRYRHHELAFRTQYAELKERTLGAGLLLPGSPGTLALRSGTGFSYWYRVYYSVPRKQSETLVCKQGDTALLQEMKKRMEFSGWASDQVSALRKLEFQVADKGVARVLVQLHNQGAFEAGLVLVGTLGYMAWLNELGVMSIASRTQDIELARGEPLKVATPLPFMHTMLATELPFFAVPGLPSSKPSTSIKLPGVAGLRVDMLAHGNILGAVIRVPELQWAAQSIPYYDYLLTAPEPAAILAGGQCIPVRLPQAARMAWHKLYSSAKRRGFPEKAAKDRHQALTLACILASDDARALKRAGLAAPDSMLKAIRPQTKALLEITAAHPELRAVLKAVLT